jgi:hypothetical protein
MARLSLIALVVLGLFTHSFALNNTVDNQWLHTWWHSTGEINTQTSVQPGNVRQSHVYDVQVASHRDGPYYDSFVYETIPRNGQGNIIDPTDPTSFSNEDDGITIEPSVNVTMAWTSFEYGADAWVKVTRRNSTTLHTPVIIRPRSLKYTVFNLKTSIVIHIPYSPETSGTRFSVEFADDLYTYRDACSSEGCGFVQRDNPWGYSYVKEYTSQNPIMGVEPRNALLIFASPFLNSNLIPDASASTTYSPEPGFVSGLDKTNATTIFFKPGVYYFSGIAHANLSSSVNWVHLSAGAYVKGAIEYSSNSTNLLATGHGVLSGEQYVYQADPQQKYKNSKSQSDTLRMWSGVSHTNTLQTFTLVGPTINSPPFNSMDFTGDLSSLTLHASDYKQVGAFFAQTDGLENYPQSQVHDVFYHSNDDTIKAYYSHTRISRITVWKATTAPTIQFGWAPRNLTNTTVSHVSIIHSRYSSNSSHPCIIGANQVYTYPESDTHTADTSSSLSNITFSNIISEGISGSLFQIVPLQNIHGLRIENVSVDTFSPLEAPQSDSDSDSSSGGGGIKEQSVTSVLPVWWDKSGEKVVVQGFVVSDFHVNGSRVTRENAGVGQLGGLNVVAGQSSEKVGFSIE